MTEETPNLGGRPTIYSQELADEMCSQLSEGKSLRKVCEAADMPAKSTVFSWLRTNTEFLDQYTRAKEEAADSLIDEIIELSDEASTVIKGDDKSDSARVQAKHLQIEARKWLASKLKPKRYGDKLDVTSDGRRIEAPIILSPIKPRDVKPEDQATNGS